MCDGLVLFTSQLVSQIDQASLCAHASHIDLNYKLALRLATPPRMPNNIQRVATIFATARDAQITDTTPCANAIRCILATPSAELSRYLPTHQDLA